MFWSPLQHDNFKVEMLHAVIANIWFVNEISEGTLLHHSMAMTCSVPSLRVDKIVVLIKRFLQVWLRFFTKELLWEEEGWRQQRGGAWITGDQWPNDWGSCPGAENHLSRRNRLSALYVPLVWDWVSHNRVSVAKIELSFCVMPQFGFHWLRQSLHCLV